MPATSRSDPPRRYVALGDSFTAGAADSQAPGFGDALAALLRSANPALDYRNLAVAGARSREVVEGQLSRALVFHPDAVTIVSGANDALLEVRPDVDEHAAALDCALGTL